MHQFSALSSRDRQRMTARVYFSLIAVLLCLFGYLSLTDATRPAAKPGRCPPQSSGRRSCTSSCKSDSNCPNNEKCCSNGCGRYCTVPYTVKPGQCPKPKNIPLCAESCFHDGQCPATQKCCPTTNMACFPCLLKQFRKISVDRPPPFPQIKSKLLV
uniref:WAP domain-containing protein n=1 Tax=Sinocyclocheilus anshuiensis TaxID=1608454 RepID=A0A671T8F3_9TELE